MIRPSCKLEEKHYLIGLGYRLEGGTYLIKLDENILDLRFFSIKLFLLNNKYLNKKLRFSLTWLKKLLVIDYNK